MRLRARVCTRVCIALFGLTGQRSVRMAYTAPPSPSPDQGMAMARLCHPTSRQLLPCFSCWSYPPPHISNFSPAQLLHPAALRLATVSPSFSGTLTMCHGAAGPIALLALISIPFIISEVPIVPIHVHRTPHGIAGTELRPTLDADHERPLDFGQPPSDVLVWSHVSDLHVSAYTPERTARLAEFFDQELATLRPSFVLASGDLTDTNRWLNMSNIWEPRGPIAEEWSTYASLVKGTLESKAAIWSCQGNHDRFSVATFSHPKNLYRHVLAPQLECQLNTTGKSADFAQLMDARGLPLHRHFAVQYASADGHTVRIVTFDATLDLAPTRHFFGHLTQPALDTMEALLGAEPKADMNIVMGHYPFNSIVSDRSSSGRDFADILRDFRVTAALSGHLHKFIPPFQRLLGRHGHGGTLELEVADFKVNSVHRIMATDAGALAFVDTVLGQWPAVLVTSPKDARFGTKFEPVQWDVRGDQQLFPLRVLTASPADIAYIRVAISRKPVASWQAAAHSSGKRMQRRRVPYVGGEYQFSWQPEGSEVHTWTATRNTSWPEDGPAERPSAWIFQAMLTRDELAAALGVPPADLKRAAVGSTYTLSVKVVDREGEVRVSEQPFTIDGTILPLPSSWSQWFITQSFRALLRQVVLLASVSVVGLVLGGTLLYDRALKSGCLRLPLRVKVTAEDVHAAEVAPTPLASVQPGGVAYDTSLLTPLERAAMRVWGSYLAAWYISPWLMRAVCLMAVWVLGGPWIFGRLFNDSPSALFAWGMLSYTDVTHLGPEYSADAPEEELTAAGQVDAAAQYEHSAPGSRWVFLPHYDANIYTTQFYVLAVAPLLQLAVMVAVSKLRLSKSLSVMRGVSMVRRDEQGAIELRTTSTLTGRVVAGVLVPDSAVAPTGSISGVLLVAALWLAVLVQVPFVVVFHGAAAALASPVPTWTTIPAAVWGTYQLARQSAAFYRLAARCRRGTALPHA